MSADARKRSSRSANASLRLSEEGKSSSAVAAALRGVAWALLYIGDQLRRQADFWVDR